MGCLSKKGQYPSTSPPTYQIIKVTNANHMSVMKTSLTIILMCPQERFSLYKDLSRLVLCYKKDWATLLHLIYFHCLLRITLSTNYLLPLISVLAENTLLETAYHFLLLLARFDTLTYRKDYDRSPILVGHHVSARRTLAMVHTQENTFTMKFSERSSYNATVKQSKIRCIKVNITCNQYK